MSKKISTLVMVVANSQILLGYKKRGFGASWWNGFGGKVREGESILEAAGRELTEECGLVANAFEQQAVLRFYLQNDQTELEVHLFRVTDYKNEPIETEEMRPQWFYFNEIPFDKMWPDDRFWMPYFLEGKKFEADFFFQDHHTLLDYKIKEIKN